MTTNCLNHAGIAAPVEIPVAHPCRAIRIRHFAQVAGFKSRHFRIEIIVSKRCFGKCVLIAYYHSMPTASLAFLMAA